MQDALARSDAEFSPLAEPLRLNLGKHRWLSADREESYSDWLAWILQGISDSAEILPLFALDDEATRDLLRSEEIRVHREVWSENKNSRTDIEIQFGERGLLIIEVKVLNPGSELQPELKRFNERVTPKNVELRLLVLLGTEAPDAETNLSEFTFTDWRTLCKRLRRYANRIKGSDLLRAAAILIFCGAVEQNLLGLSCHPRRLRTMATVNYLHEWRCEA
ncbi:MAG: hypothetical protein P4K93_08750 [Terracidiphilus sp.]|nr:hypothetical protein [Terracidiphilus sp.]MDR3798227.1 hypothetical protein [Terracidiphilus sp.]